MSSDYEISDEENEYYDEDDEMMEVDDGAYIPYKLIMRVTRILTQVHRYVGSASDIEVDGFGDDFRVATRGDQKVYEVDHSSLSQPDVERIMQTDVDHISGIFGVEVCLSGPLYPSVITQCVFVLLGV